MLLRGRAPVAADRELQLQSALRRLDALDVRARQNDTMLVDMHGTAEPSTEGCQTRFAPTARHRDKDRIRAKIAAAHDVIRTFRQAYVCCSSIN